MKQKLSITIENETVRIIEELVKTGKFRNKSHAFEYSINKILRDEQ